MNLAHCLRRRRAELGYTQVEFGHLLGLPGERISALEAGTWRYTLPAPVQGRLARLLGCPVAALGSVHRPRRGPRGPRVPERLVHTGATLGASLTSRRCALGLTQEALATRLRVHHTSICRWEAGRVRPRRAMLRRLARALECHVEDFFCDQAPGDHKDVRRRTSTL
jgi:transcriptional regulator with XRE-family HTH domain